MVRTKRPVISPPFWQRAIRWGRKLDRHQAKYLSPSAFYSFCFSLPEGTNIFNLSESLLRGDVARFAMIPQSEELRLAHRFKELIKTRRTATSIAEWSEVEQGEVRLLSWVRKHPRLGVPILLRLALALLRTLLGRRPKEEPDRDSETKAGPDVARDAIQFIDESMADARLTLGIRGAIDRTFYASAYLDEVPFIRLELEPTYVTSTYFDNEPFVCDLLLHRSGVAILSFGIAAESVLGTDELLDMATSASLKFTKTQIPTSLSGREALPQEIALEDDIGTELRSGVVWRTTTWRDDISLTDIFDVYRHRIMEAIGKSAARADWHPAWFCYTFLVVNGLGCCEDRNSWMRSHGEELSGLLLRVPNYGTLSEAAIRDLPPDESLTRDESTYFNSSHALSVRWQFGEDPGPDVVHGLWTQVLIENALLQHWQLDKIDWLLSAPRVSSKSFSRVQEEAMTGIVEYRHSRVAFGSAQDTIRRLLARFESDRTYAQIMDRLGTFAQLQESRSTEVASRRTVLVASLGFLAAVAFGLPAINESVELLTKATFGGVVGRVLGPLREYALAHPDLTWLLYAIVLLIAFIFVGLALRWRTDLRRTRVAPRRFGIAWKPEEFRVTLVQNKYRRGFAQPRGEQKNAGVD